MFTTWRHAGVTNQQQARELSHAHRIIEGGRSCSRQERGEGLLCALPARSGDRSAMAHLLGSRCT